MPALEHFYERLAQTGRAQSRLNGIPCWVATERLGYSADRARRNDCGTTQLWQLQKRPPLKQCVQGWIQILGPTTPAFAERLGLDLLRFPGVPGDGDAGPADARRVRAARSRRRTTIEWCERRILQRIHRLTLATARKQVEPVAPAVYMRWVLGWQHVAPQTQLAGEEGVLQALLQLEGFEAPAVEWERTLLPARVADYDPRWLDQLCLSGAVGWGASRRTLPGRAAMAPRRAA